MIKQLLTSLRAIIKTRESITKQNKSTFDMALFAEEFSRFRELSSVSATPNRFPINESELFPCLEDRHSQHEVDHHYVYHTAWAARVLANLRPPFHVDISSYLYFSTIVSAFVPVDYYDYRPAALNLPNLTATKADLTNLSFASNSVSSLSCMHVVEHIGLGRYGDPLNPDGDLLAMSELQRCLAVDGHLLFVVPLGTPRVCFNAHRIYSKEMVCDAMHLCDLAEFVLISDRSGDTGLIHEPSDSLLREQSYGCGCFLFRKTHSS